MTVLLTLLDLVGLGLIVWGVSLWSVPLAFVAAGVAVLIVSWRLS